MKILSPNGVICEILKFHGSSKQRNLIPKNKKVYPIKVALMIKNCLEGNSLGKNFWGAICPGGICLGVIFPGAIVWGGGNCPEVIKKGKGLFRKGGVNVSKKFFEPIFLNS